jgi:hypothetical protein
LYPILYLSQDISMARGYREKITLRRSGGADLSALTWKDPVATVGDLSTVGTPSVTPAPLDGEARVVKDVDNIYVYDATGDSWILVSGAGATTFAGLTDVPNSYITEGGKLVSVKDSEDGLEFIEIIDGGGF